MNHIHSVCRLPYNDIDSFCIESAILAAGFLQHFGKEIVASNVSVRTLTQHAQRVSMAARCLLLELMLRGHTNI